MAEKETIDKVKAEQGLLSEIQNLFTLGYGTKEDLRELDKKLRDKYYEAFRKMRHIWEDVYEAAMDAGLTTSNRDFKRIIQILDRITEKVRHADYGYAGLMDRKGHMREEELAQVFNYDKALGAEMQNLEEKVNKANTKAEQGEWETTLAETKEFRKLLLAFENQWSERENQFRPLDIE